VDDEAEFVAVAGKVASTLDGGTLLDVLEDLRVAGLVADDEQAAASVLHGLEGVVVGGDARRAGPGEAEGLQLLAQLDGACLLDVEGVVVEEKLLDVGKELLGVGHLGCHIVGRALAPCMAGESLGPEAEGALRRAATGAVERDVGVQKERNVVLGDVEVPVIYLGGPGHLVELFRGNLRAVGIVQNLAGCRIFVGDAQDLIERLAVGVLNYGEIELAAADEVDGGALG